MEFGMNTDVLQKLLQEHFSDYHSVVWRLNLSEPKSPTEGCGTGRGRHWQKLSLDPGHLPQQESALDTEHHQGSFSSSNRTLLSAMSNTDYLLYSIIFNYFNILCNTVPCYEYLSVILSQFYSPQTVHGIVDLVLILHMTNRASFIPFDHRRKDLALLTLQPIHQDYFFSVGVANNAYICCIVLC